MRSSRCSRRRRATDPSETMSTLSRKPQRKVEPRNEAPRHAVATRGERPVEPLIFEKSTPGVRGVDLPPLDVPRTDPPGDLVTTPVALPEVGQHDVMAHY